MDGGERGDFMLTLPFIRCSDEEPWTERMKLFSLPSSSSKTAVTDALQKDSN